MTRLGIEPTITRAMYYQCTILHMYHFFVFYRVYLNQGRPDGSDSQRVDAGKKGKLSLFTYNCVLFARHLDTIVNDLMFENGVKSIIDKCIYNMHINSLRQSKVLRPRRYWLSTNEATVPFNIHN